MKGIGASHSGRGRLQQAAHAPIKSELQTATTCPTRIFAIRFSRPCSIMSASPIILLRLLHFLCCPAIPSSAPSRNRSVGEKAWRKEREEGGIRGGEKPSIREGCSGHGRREVLRPSSTHDAPVGWMVDVMAGAWEKSLGETSDGCA